MATTTVNLSNIAKPAPRWFRITKKIVYGVFATALFGSVLQRFGVSGDDVSLISATLITVMETLGSVLANGEDYAPTESK